MTQVLTRKRIVVYEGMRALAAKASWHGLALAAVLILSSFLDLFRLTNEGYGITYYAAAVKDMLTSWHDFFFVSFDAGFVSVDKPPLGLWVQAATSTVRTTSMSAVLLRVVATTIGVTAKASAAMSPATGPKGRRTRW